MNKCEAGHYRHTKKIVDTDIGKMVVYDFDQYKDFNGYCTGQDDISRTLANEGTWGREESAMIKALLEKGEKDSEGKRTGIVMDFGSHIGWFTIMAAQLGYRVKAFEGDIENVETMVRNAREHSVLEQVQAFYMWVKADSKKIRLANYEVELLKIDLEGSEQYAIEMMEMWLKHKKIRNIFIEVSPVFNDSYEVLVQKIIDYGFDAFRDGKPWDGKLDFAQDNLLFCRK